MNRTLLLILFLSSFTSMLLAQNADGWEYFEPDKNAVPESKKVEKKVKPVAPKSHTTKVPRALYFNTYDDYCDGKGYDILNLSLIHFTRPNCRWWELNEYKVSAPASELESTMFGKRTFAVQVDDVLYVNMWHYKGFGATYKRVKVMPDGSMMFVNNPKDKRFRGNPSVYPLIMGGGIIGGAIGGAIAGAITGSMRSSGSDTLEDQFCYVIDPVSKKIKPVDEEILKSILADKVEIFDDFKARLHYYNYSANVVMRVLCKAGIVSEKEISGGVSAIVQH